MTTKHIGDECILNNNRGILYQTKRKALSKPIALKPTFLAINLLKSIALEDRIVRFRVHPWQSLIHHECVLTGLSTDKRGLIYHPIESAGGRKRSITV